MAFLTYLDIRDVLPADHNRSKVERLLSLIEDSLLYDYGVDFDGFSPEQAWDLYVDRSQELKHVFALNHFKQPTEVKIVSNRGNAIKELTENTDYLIYESIFKPTEALAPVTVYNTIEVINGLYVASNCHLKITAEVGFGDTTPNFLKTAILDYIEDYTILDNNNWQAITSSNIDGVSSVSYDTNNSQINKVSKDPMTDSRIMQAINRLFR